MCISGSTLKSSIHGSGQPMLSESYHISRLQRAEYELARDWVPKRNLDSYL
jgi:hypothetical protein